MSLRLKGKITVELNFLRSKTKRFIFFIFLPYVNDSDHNFFRVLQNQIIKQYKNCL